MSRSKVSFNGYPTFFSPVYDSIRFQRSKSLRNSTGHDRPTSWRCGHFETFSATEWSFNRQTECMYHVTWSFSTFHSPLDNRENFSIAENNKRLCLESKRNNRKRGIIERPRESWYQQSEILVRLYRRFGWGIKGCCNAKRVSYYGGSYIFPNFALLIHQPTTVVSISRMKLFVATDALNSLYTDKTMIRVSSVKKVKSSQVSIFQSFMSFLKTDWVRILDSKIRSSESSLISPSLFSSVQWCNSCNCQWEIYDTR